MSVPRLPLVAAGVVATAALYGFAVRSRLNTWGATPAEIAATFPGDELVPVDERLNRSTIATTIAAPPSEVWPWLVQMGNDRAGFYSWDRLDNAGRPSAERIHPEWQQLAEGDRVICVPDGSVWFDVAHVEPERALVLRSSLTLRGRPFDVTARPPRGFSDSTWGFFLTPTPDGGTRLVVRGSGRGRPRAAIALGGFLFWEPAHCVMQTKQFRELRRRCAAAGASLPLTTAR